MGAYLMLRFYKDPDATLDFLFDWTDWLQSAETISSHTVTISPTGTGALTLDSSSVNSGIVTAWLSAGVLGTVYDVACSIETSDSRIDERTMRIRIQER